MFWNALAAFTEQKAQTAVLEPRHGPWVIPLPPLPLHDEWHSFSATRTCLQKGNCEICHYCPLSEGHKHCFNTPGNHPSVSSKAWCVADHSVDQGTYRAGWSAAGGRPVSQLWGQRRAGSWPRQWCCLWGSPHVVQSAGGERESSQHYPLKPGFVTNFTGQRWVLISKQHVSKALYLAVWILLNTLLVMLFSRESLFLFSIPSSKACMLPF